MGSNGKRWIDSNASEHDSAIIIWRACERVVKPSTRPNGTTKYCETTRAVLGVMCVVDGRMSTKGSVVNTGDLTTASKGWSEVRIAIVAKKSGNSDGAKGGREVNTLEESYYEDELGTVHESAKQTGEAYQDAKRRIWSTKMLAALEKGVKGNKWFSLVDKVHRMETLKLAWERVARNDGASGMDGITVEYFGRDLAQRLESISKDLKQDSYIPKSVKRVRIPKPGSKEKRPLGIPTVRDRVVQTALKLVIEPIFEKEFSPQSFGSRPGRGSKDALRRVSELLKEGYVHVVDADIKGYFDNIPHEQLMERVRERIADGRILELIEAFLKQGVVEEGKEEIRQSTSGTPQGGVISPVLANLYLNPLDWILSGLGIEAARYVDDQVILCKTPEEATQALKLVKEWMESAGLELHPEKTKIVDMGVPGQSFDFLGYRFWRSKTGKMKRYIRPKSARKFKGKIKPFTKRANGLSMETLIDRLNPILRGFYEYFKHVSPKTLNDYDGWVRGRLRAILRKRCKLRGRARSPDQQRWNNHYFSELGLYCMEQARAAASASLRKGAKC